MQFISFYLFTLLCSYSLIICAPIQPAKLDTPEAKHQKATEIAHRLLKELAGEHDVAPSNVETANKKEEEQKDTTVPAVVNRPKTEKVETHIEKPVVEDSYDEDNQDLELTPTINDLYEMYNEKYIHLPGDDDDDESSSEVIDDEDQDDDDDYLLPINRDDLLRYLAEQEETNDHVTTAPQVPIMDDSVMTAEDHQRRRRSIY